MSSGIVEASGGTDCHIKIVQMDERLCPVYIFYFFWGLYLKGPSWMVLNFLITVVNIATLLYYLSETGFL